MNSELIDNESEDSIQQRILKELRSLRLDLDRLKGASYGYSTRMPSFPLTATPSHQVAGATLPDTSASFPAAIGIRDNAPRSFELQTAYNEVREKYSSRKLHGDLLFSTQRRNVKTEDAPVYTVLTKVAKYCETGLKIVSSEQSTEDSEVVSDCLIVFTSVLRYVQDEGVQLVVNKNYDKDWASQYKSIMSGQTDVRAENISAMDRTATILKHRYTGNNDSRNFSGRGRSRGGRMRRPYRGRLNDVRARDSDLHTSADD